MSIKTDIERGLKFEDDTFVADLAKGMFLRFERHPDPCDKTKEIKHIILANYNIPNNPARYDEIADRTYDSIITEVKTILRHTYESVANTYCDRLENGYRG